MTGVLIFWFSEVIWLDNGTIFTHGLWKLQALLQSFNVIIQLEFVIKTSVYMWRLFYQIKTIAIYIWNVATRLNGVAWEFWSRSSLNMGTAQSLLFLYYPSYSFLLIHCLNPYIISTQLWSCIAFSIGSLPTFNKYQGYWLFVYIRNLCKPAMVFLYVLLNKFWIWAMYAHLSDFCCFLCWWLSTGRMYSYIIINATTLKLENYTIVMC